MKKLGLILSLLALFILGLWLRLYSLTPLEERSRQIQVHIEGEVAEPGLYILDEEKRLGELIEEAGGLTSKAGEVNLAEKLIDGQKIIIPRIWEAEDEDSREAPPPGSQLHSMTREDWMEIPGIGEVTAGLILDYLKDNRAAGLDELINVKGIGAKKLEVIRQHLGNR